MLWLARRPTGPSWRQPFSVGSRYWVSGWRAGRGRTYRCLFSVQEETSGRALPGRLVLALEPALISRSIGLLQHQTSEFSVLVSGVSAFGSVQCQRHRQSPFRSSPRRPAHSLIGAVSRRRMPCRSNQRDPHREARKAVQGFDPTARRHHTWKLRHVCRGRPNPVRSSPVRSPWVSGIILARGGSQFA